MTFVQIRAIYYVSVCDGGGKTLMELFIVKLVLDRIEKMWSDGAAGR